MSDKIDLELVDSLADLRMSPEARDHGRGMAPPPRRKSFSKLRRRLSQTFRFSFNGSLSEFSTAWPGGEDGGGDRANGKFYSHTGNLEKLKRNKKEKKKSGAG